MTQEQSKHSEKLALEIIEGLSDIELKELAQGYSNDLEVLFSDLKQQCYEATYDIKKLDTNIGGAGLTNFNTAVHKALQIDSFAYFIMTVTPKFDMNWHHLEWVNLIETHPRLCVLSCRGGGKSFFFSKEYPLWKMFRYTKDPKIGRKDLYLSIYGMLFSFSIAQAKDLLRIIKDEIEDNDILKEVLYPNNRKEDWNKEAIFCKNGARLKAKGFGSAVRGAHPGYMIIDDPLNDNSMYSAEQRDKTITDFHGKLMNLIEPGGQVVVVGTPFHKEDLYGNLKTKSHWIVREFPAIYPNGDLLWKERITADNLIEKKESQGTTIFSREMLCRPVSNDSSLFPYDTLHSAIKGMEDYTLVTNISNFPYKFDKVVMGCDYALSANVSADYSVFTVWGVDSEDRMWLLNMQRFKGKSYNEQISTIEALYRAFFPIAIYSESNQFQMVMAQGAKEKDLPIYPHTTNKHNKNNFDTGIPSLSILFEKGQIKLPYGDEISRNTADMLMSEFHSITFTDKGIRSVDGHDDIPMSCWLATLAKRHGEDEGAGFKFFQL